MGLLTSLDLIVFFVTLLGVMAVGFYAGRREETSEDFFLAGRAIPWYGVAGSIFGSNVSANHLVGMLGIGFSVGFAQSHFELGAIAGLLMLCYGFLPVYRKLQLYTLSEYLGRRYDQRSQVAYAVIMVVIMAFVQMVPAMYIGSRFICVLMGGQALLAGDGAAAGTLVNMQYYTAFVIALAVIAASYTVLGGLKAVVWTDVIQSVLLLLAGIGVALLTFQQLGGWSEMLRLDAAAEAPRMGLYLPMNHPDLPWTGVLTGLVAMHCFYWGTNQFIVQRALGARSDSEARVGIIAAGFLKLLIPFFSIGAGVAAYYLFQRDGSTDIAPDTAFPELVKRVIHPFGWGMVGLVAAGLIGAILSSIDSMMNSAATIITVDIYQRYVDPEASDKRLIAVGRVTIVVLVTLAALLAIFILDPNSERNFFLQIADYQNYLTPGILVAFLLGMFWRRGTATAGFATILAGVFFSWLVAAGYDQLLQVPAVHDWLVATLGERLNFFHRVVLVMGLCGLLYVVVSLLGRPDPEKSRLTWTELGGHDPRRLGQIGLALLASLAVLAGMAGLVYAGLLPAAIAAVLAGLWTAALFVLSMLVERPSGAWLLDDRLWGGLLAGTAMFMMFYFA